MGTPPIKTACMIVAVSLLLQSCLFQKRAEFDSAVAESQEYFNKADFQRSIDVCRALYNKYPEDKTVLGNYIETIQKIYKAADRDFSRGDLMRAEKTYELLLANSEHFRPFAKHLSFTSVTLTGKIVKSVEETKEAADKEFRAGDYFRAGRKYRTLLDNYASFSAVAPSLAFDKQTVDGSLRDCSRHLHQKGLDLYRKGNLAEALSTWKSILVFDPENETVRKAVDTTTIQMRNLQKE